MGVRCGRRGVLLMFALTVAGCGRGAPKERNQTQDRLYKLGKYYLQACYSLKRAPADFDEIKDNVDADVADDLLVSPRDGQKFVIFWGVDFTTLAPARATPFTIAGYEKDGVDGKRYVLRFPIGTALMTDEELQKAVFPPGHKAPGQ